MDLIKNVRYLQNLASSECHILSVVYQQFLLRETYCLDHWHCKEGKCPVRFRCMLRDHFSCVCGVQTDTRTEESFGSDLPLRAHHGHDHGKRPDAREARLSYSKDRHTFICFLVSVKTEKIQLRVRCAVIPLWCACAHTPGALWCWWCWRSTSRPETGRY